MTNIAEILKDCPTGTKLYSPICGECELFYINKSKGLIETKLKCGRIIVFQIDGRSFDGIGECLLFPSKDNRDWSTFNKPKFKKGDFVVSQYGTIGILNGRKEEEFNTDCTFCSLSDSNRLIIGHAFEPARFATEEEKQKLLIAINNNKYIWDSEKLELRKKEYQFQPFDKVLVRDDMESKWQPAFYGYKKKTSHRMVGGDEWNYCIPFEGTRELLGTTNNSE